MQTIKVCLHIDALTLFYILHLYLISFSLQLSPIIYHNFKMEKRNEAEIFRLTAKNIENIDDLKKTENTEFQNEVDTLKQEDLIIDQIMVNTKILEKNNKSKTVDVHHRHTDSMKQLNTIKLDMQLLQDKNDACIKK